MQITRLLYTSLVDISVPYGPGVNETGFIRDMYRRYGSNFMALIPRPMNGLPHDLSAAKIEYLNYAPSSRGPLGWVESRVSGMVRLPFAINHFDPDFIVMRAGAVFLPGLVFLKRRMSIPYALRVAVNGSFEDFYSGNRFRRIFTRYNQHIYGSLVKHANVIDIVTERKKTELIERYPFAEDRVFVIDNGVDVNMFSRETNSSVRTRFNIANDTIVLGYVGGFPWRRGAKQLIDCIHALISKELCFNVHGMIVGDNGDAAVCRDYAQTLGISESITVTGRVAFDQVPKYMSAMDIGISIRDYSEQGCSELKVRQYLASGLCVIGSKGSNDFLRGQPFARILETGSQDEILTAYEQLTEKGKDELTQLGTQATAYARKHLSVESKNDRRLELWRNSLSDKGLLQGEPAL